MWRLADRLGFVVPDQTWPVLVEAATFAHMRGRADRLVPGGVLKDVGAFFRQGRSGGWRELLSDEEVAHYNARVATLAPPDLLGWLYR